MGLFTLPLGVQWLQLVNADKVDGIAVGFLNFSFTEAQLDARRGFTEQIMSTPRARARTGRTGLGSIRFLNSTR